LCRSESILEYLADALGKFKGADRRGWRLRSRRFPDVSAWMRRGLRHAEAGARRRNRGRDASRVQT
jgi:hypothetical protein